MSKVTELAASQINTADTTKLTGPRPSSSFGGRSRRQFVIRVVSPTPQPRLRVCSLRPQPRWPASEQTGDSNRVRMLASSKTRRGDTQLGRPALFHV